MGHDIVEVSSPTTGLSRRSFLAASVLGTAALAGCGTGFALRGGGGGSVEGRLSLTLWAGDAELPAFEELAQQWSRGSGVPVRLNVVPFGELLTGVDANLASDRAPDLFRVTYQDLGLYAEGDALLDLTDLLPAAVTDGFAPAFRTAVSVGDRLYGVPHHTDTSMVLYDVEALEAAGARIPTSPEDAWEWEEFRAVMAAVPRQDGRFAFGVNWQQAGAYRWLNWLEQRGGRFLDEDLTGPAVDSRAARDALSFTQGFFTDGLVPPTSSTKGAFVDELFKTGTLAAVFAGNFLLPPIDPVLGEAGRRYGAAFLPRDEQVAADLGGNALVATASSANPEAAADFLAFMAGDEAQARFCELTNALPTRTALQGRQLDFAVRPDLMEAYVAQATTITDELARQVTVPQFNAVNNSLVDRLEEAFLGGGDPDEVLAGLADDVRGRLE